MTIECPSVWGTYSVFWNQWRVYLKTWWINLLPPVLEPVMYLFAFGYGLGPLIGSVAFGDEKVSYIRFIAPGMMAVGVLFSSFFEGAYGSYIRWTRQKLWHLQLTAPVNLSDILAGDLCWSAMKGIWTGALTGVVACIWGVLSPAQFLIALPAIVLGSFLFGAFGLASAATIKNIDQLQLPIQLGVVPMFSLCGAYFPRSTLPAGMQEVANWLPLSPVVDLMRTTSTTPVTEIVTHVALIVVWIVVLSVWAVTQITKKVYP